MRAASTDSLTLAQTALVSALNVMALACLAAVLAYWTWRWSLGPSEPAASTAPAAVGSAERASGLFGDAGAAGPVAESVGVRLWGVVAGSGGRTGYAVMQLDGQAIVSVRAGTVVAPGLLLVEVHPRSVILERSGVRERLALPVPAVPGLPSPGNEMPMPCDPARQPCPGPTPP